MDAISKQTEEYKKLERQVTRLKQENTELKAALDHLTVDLETERETVANCEQIATEASLSEARAIKKIEAIKNILEL